MPDTGAPWNIPYVAATDLVSDWPTDSQDLAEAIADGLDGAGIIQNVHTSLDTTFSSSLTSGSSTDVTGLTATITPTSTGSKILVAAVVNGHNGSEAGVANQLFRDSTLLGGGDVAGNRTNLTGYNFGATFNGAVGTSSYMLLDSPATTSAITYKITIVNMASVTRTLYINRSPDDSDNANRPRTASSITLLEFPG